MSKIIIMLIMIVCFVLSLVVVFVNGIRCGVSCLQHRDSFLRIQALKKSGIAFLVVLILIFIVTWISQLAVYTPKIKGNDGKVVEGSIAELRKVTVNGHKEWISIRGKDKTAPVLLFLAGGPGGTQMAATRHELAALEEHFVVVNWDQPGSGKSYRCMKRSDITVQTYINDGVALTEYLLEQFGQSKIYLMGESWGSALGIFLISKKPEYYAGFIGTGQMVDFEETERMDYNKALEIASERKDQKTIDKLKKQGEPLYYSGNIAMQSATYLNYLSAYMGTDPNITNGGYNTFRDMFSSEYGMMDSVNYLLGIMNTFNAVYPQLYEIDLRDQYVRVDVPVYFFLGRHDINAPISIAEDYYDRLEAPKKELIWFEHSGHSPWLNETDSFIKETVRVFLD